jgi:hypothetical protein
LTNPRNPNIRDRHPPPAPESNTTWHSSTTIRSNRPIARCRLMKCPKLSDTAASGVTNTIDAHSCGLRPLHSTHSIPNASHRSLMSPRNDTNGTTTIVTPPPAAAAHAAGNMNNMLLPPPVPITTTIGLSCRMIACNAASCTPRNRASGPNMRCNSAPMSTCRIFFHRWSSSAMACCVTSANRDGLTCLPPSSPRMTESNMQNACHSRLTRRNAIRRASVLNNDSSVDRP